MTLVFLALIAGSLFYLSRIVLEYRSYEINIMPVVEALESKIEQLRAQTVNEGHKIADVKQRVAALRGIREDLMQDAEELKGQLVAEKTQYKALALALQKRQFQGTLARGRKLVLR